MAAKQLPLYKLIIDDSLESDLQVSYVALVDRPAIEKNFLAFTEKKLSFVVDPDKREIWGAAMLADYPIYRQDDEIGDHLVSFDKETIYQISQKFFEKGYNKNFNIGHNSKDTVEGVNIYQSYIVDSSQGRPAPTGFDDVKDGSWFIGAKVNNDAVWESIKNDEIKGFSVEGYFRYTKADELKDQDAEELFNQIALLINSDEYTEQGKYNQLKTLLDCVS